MHSAAAMVRIDIVKRAPGRASMLGWGFSLLAHLLAVAWLLNASPLRQAGTEAGQAKRIEVRLVPIVPEAARATAAPHAAAPRPGSLPAPPRPLRRGHVVSPTSSPTRQNAPADMPKPAETKAATDMPAGATAPAATVPVDMAAARTTARLLARESGKGLVALPARKPVVDPNADRQVVDPMERARRPDCQTARAGSTNLLANVALLAVDLAKNAIDD
ncbi:MAG: hypothetical protein WCC39_16375, partial [Telluria sp.]